MTTVQPPARTCCKTLGNVRGVHENGNGPCEWVPVDAPTEQEWRILEEIRRRDDGQPDGAFSGVLATWAQGKMRMLFEPAEPKPAIRMADPVLNLSEAQVRRLTEQIQAAILKQAQRGSRTRIPPRA